MADQSNDQNRDDRTGGQQRQQNALSEQGQQSQSHREDAGQSPLASPEGKSEETSGDEVIGAGQPLGGNDSNTGTGTTLTQGFESSSKLSLNHAKDSEGEQSQKDADEGGFIGSEAKGSNNYRHANNPELSREDSLDQNSDQGMGLAGSSE